MADDSCHLKTNCTNVDVTSNLKQRKHGKVVIRQSKGLISSRGIHPSNFSAWIECFKSFEDRPVDPDGSLGQAQVDAMEMQAKIKQIEKDRNERLQQFQQEVSERVKRARRKKQQEHLDKSLEQFEKETKVICQSAFPKRILSVRKDTCSFRSSISVDKIKNIMTGEANVDSRHNIDNVLKSVSEIDLKTREIKIQSSQARAGLISKMMNADMTNLPGGFWGDPKSKDKDDEKLSTDYIGKRMIDESNVIIIVNGDRDGNEELTERDEDVLEQISIDVKKERERQHGEILNDMWKGFDVNEMVTCNNEAGQGSDNAGSLKKKDKRRIRFMMPDKESFQDDRLPENSQTALQSKQGENAVNSFVGMERTEDKENKNQYWTYRRLFMDIEREKVREMIRRKNHKKVITKLKLEKEKERCKTEKEVEVCIPNQNKEKPDLVHKKVADRETGKAKLKPISERRKETIRYIDALKNLILQRVSGDDTRLPPVCSCGNSLLETHPDTCANNCIFYNNPKEFARVLSSVLATMNT